MFSALKKYVCIWDVAVALICFFFVLIKLPFLNLPYFWDEAWVYAPAVFDMYENGPSLSPNSIDPELSRGHPILFHFLAVCWMTLFGTSFSAVHAFSVFLSVLLLWTVYKLGSQVASKQVGFWCAAIFALQPIFIQQAGFLLPEVQLSLFVALTILFYLQKRHWLFILSATAMLLTKETGILILAMIGFLELFQFSRDKDFSKKRVFEFLSIGVPVVLTSVYFLVQYNQFGWFMFPEHMSMFDTDPEIWRHKRELVFSTVFGEQQRPIIIGVALASASLAWQNGPKILRVLFGFIGLTFLTMEGTGSWLPNWYYFWVFPALIIAATIWLATFFSKRESKNHLFFPLIGLSCLVLILFTSAHFVIGRYLLLLIPLVIICVVSIFHLATKKSAFLFNVCMLSLGLIFYHLANKADARMNDSDNMKYVNQVQLIQEGIAYLENNVSLDSCISGTFIIQQALQNPVQGYRNTDKLPSCIDNAITPATDYVLTLSFNNDNGALAAVESDSAFAKIWESKKGNHYARIYGRE